MLGGWGVQIQHQAGWFLSINDASELREEKDIRTGTFLGVGIGKREEAQIVMLGVWDM